MIDIVLKHRIFIDQDDLSIDLMVYLIAFIAFQTVFIYNLVYIDTNTVSLYGAICILYI